MIFPQLAQFTDIALLLLRLMVGLVFITSGYKHLKDPAARSKDIGMSKKSFTIFLGAAEFAGGLGIISGVLAQLAAIGLILVMLGAIQKKIFTWHIGFWGKSVKSRLELRHNARPYESGYRHHRRRKPDSHSPNQIRHSIIQTRTSTRRVVRN